MGSSTTSRLALLMTVLCVSLQWAYIFRASVVAAFPDRAPPILLTCLASGKGGKVLGSSRDCGLGQGPVCSREQPCTPCSTGLSCARCSRSNLGDCGFVAGYGPYCSDSAGAVAPCTRCCSL